MGLTHSCGTHILPCQTILINFNQISNMTYGEWWVGEKFSASFLNDALTENDQNGADAQSKHSRDWSI